MKENQPTDLNENLCCSLCKSYLIDAVTLTECLHSYCRACLLHNIEKDEECRCTKCACSFGKDLAEAFTRDEVLQKVVYKVVPEVYWQELKRRGEFLKKRIVSSDEKALILDKKLIQLASELCAPNEMVSLCLEYISPGAPDNEIVEDNHNDRETVNATKLFDDSKPSTVAEADRLVKQETMLTSFRRYFRCLAATKISALRKLLEAKLEVSDTYRLFFVDSDCNSTLDDQCTLQDVAYMFSWRRDGPMKILFTLQRHLEEEKPPVLDMEFTPELVAEEPLSQGNTAVTAAIETPVQLPALTVSLNTSMMEGGPNHQPIITTEVHPPPRKKRKPAAPTKKQQVASPVPVQRMTGVSPLAKGPPPPVRPENAGAGKKSGSCGRTKTAEKTSTKAPSRENAPPVKQAKLLPTSFDNKLQQIINSTPSRPAKTSKGNRTKAPSKVASASTSELSVQSVSRGKSPDLLLTRTGNTNANSQDVNSTTDCDIKTKSNDLPKEQTENGVSKENNKVKSPSKLHTISKITESATPLSTAVPAPASTTTTSATVSHPRPIQPRPSEMKINYESLVKNYSLNGAGSKLSPFSLDGKHIGFNPAIHMQPSLFMDPKIAAQPIKHLLSGRGMPLIPETNPYLRNPMTSFMPNLHMQPPAIPGLPGNANTPQLPPLSSGSQSPSSSAGQQHSTTTSATPTSASTASSKNSQQQQLVPSAVPLLAATSADNSSKTIGCGNSSSSSSSSRASSPTAKLQQKITCSMAIPTAHITPFMSQS